MTNFRISIPEPCHEDWEKMSAQQKGRYCHSCEKVVADFTSFSDEELRDFFQQYPKRKEKPCGRFRLDQVSNHYVEIPFQILRPHRYSPKQIVILCILICFGVSFSSCSGSKSRSQKLNNDAKYKLVAKIDSSKLDTISAVNTMGGDTMDSELLVETELHSVVNNDTVKLDLEDIDWVKKYKLELPEVLTGDIHITTTLGFSISPAMGAVAMPEVIPRLEKFPIAYKNEPILFLAEEMPKYNGGEQALKKFFLEHLKFPKKASLEGVCGTAYVQFAISTEGSIIYPYVINNLGSEEVEKEVLRLLALMPKWLPGTEQGKAANVVTILPIDFECKS